MYLTALSIWSKKYGLKSFRDIVFKVSNLKKRSKLLVGVDIVLSNILFGSTFQEYMNLKFYDRTYKNRNTYLTTYYNLRNYRKLNDDRGKIYFKDKSKFNEKFTNYIGRDWIEVESYKSEVLGFIRKHKYIIVKPKTGDSGKGIYIINNTDFFSDKNLDQFIKENKNCILEEVLVNHPVIDKLNKSSLNTLRIISIVTEGNVEFLYAGIRVGVEGEVVDNISKGGRIAAIDISTGIVTSELKVKLTSSEDIKYNDTQISGCFTIPLWKETLDFVRSATKVLPEMRYVAWDVAITNKGPVIIEGNHTSGNTVIQAHLGIKEEGLKSRMKSILNLC